MRTRRMILSIVAAVALLAAGCLVVPLLTLWLWPGLAVGAAAAGAVLAVYWSVHPWQVRWGATDEEVRRVMPGDELVEGAGGTTRAITVAAPAEQVWPWLAQIGYGWARWYSYDRIDNEGRPSAGRILPGLQDLWSATGS